MSTSPAILIVGTGALACLFAARLTDSGVTVTMLGSWPDGLAALQADGVRLASSSGEKRFAVRATADPAQCRGIGHALVLVKAWQTERAAAQLAACLPADGLALSLQNGWGNREALSAALGAERVALGVTTGGATLLGPGHVRPGGEGTITLGRHLRIGPLAGLLSEAGFDVGISDNLDGVLWAKLLVNAAINPLTALLRVPNGDLLQRPPARNLMAQAALESAAVADALGLSLPIDDPVAAVEAVARRTAANHSSMLQDIRRGPATEIDAISGAIVRASETLAVPTPVNRTLWQLVRALQP